MLLKLRRIRPQQMNKNDKLIGLERNIIIMKNGFCFIFHCHTPFNKIKYKHSLWTQVYYEWSSKTQTIRTLKINPVTAAEIGWSLYLKNTFQDISPWQILKFFWSYVLRHPQTEAMQSWESSNHLWDGCLGNPSGRGKQFSNSQKADHF